MPNAPTMCPTSPSPIRPDHIVADLPVIQLRGLRLMCLCGALPEEHSRRQPYELDIDVSADVNAATQSDRLADTIDYGGLLDRIEQVAASERFDLFERMAQRIAEVVLEDHRVESVAIELRKLRPPVTQDLASSGIRLVRRR